MLLLVGSSVTEDAFRGVVGGGLSNHLDQKRVHVQQYNNFFPCFDLSACWMDGWMDGFLSVV